MPYIAVHTSAKLSPGQRNDLSRAFAELITIIPGKSVANLMLAFFDEVPMVLDGAEKPDFAFLELRIRGSASQEEQKRFTLGCFDIFERILNIPPANLYTTIQEFAHWGARGNYL